MTADAPSRPPPRPHHLRFKYALVTRAIYRPSELIDLCASNDELFSFWNTVGEKLPELERIAPTGLSARNVGDPQRPVVMISLPPPERPNEAYFLCIMPSSSRLDADGSLFIPDPVGPLELRVFGMERSVLPNGGLIGFVVEWTPALRHNYDAPDDGSPGAFWKAILEVFGGTRKPLQSTAIELDTSN